MATLLNEIQERLKMMEASRMKKERENRSSNHQIDKNSHYFAHQFDKSNIKEKNQHSFPVENHDNDRNPSNHKDNNFDSKSHWMKKIAPIPPTEVKAPDADYVNYNEIVELAKEIEEIRLRKTNEESKSTDKTIKRNVYHPTHPHFYPDDDDGGGRRYIFEDIPGDILFMVDELIDKGQDIAQHFQAIDEAAFKPRLFHSNFPEKDLESDTDSGNGTLQTENGSLSSQTLHDPEPSQRREETNSPNERTAIYSIPNRPPSSHFNCDATIPPPDFLGNLTELSQYSNSRLGNKEVTSFGYQTNSPNPQMEFINILPPPEFSEENICSGGSGLYVKGLNANRGALKKVPQRSPAILDKIPGTFLSQSCIDLSQISPKRRVTFADEVTGSILNHENIFKNKQQTVTGGKSKLNPDNDTTPSKSKTFNVFKLLTKKHQNDKENDAKVKKKLKKKHKQKSKSRSSEEISDDPFSPDDFNDFSSDDDSNDEQETPSFKVSDTYKYDDTFLTSFDTNMKSEFSFEDSNRANTKYDRYEDKRIYNETHSNNSRNKFPDKSYFKRSSVDVLIEKTNQSPNKNRNSTPDMSVHQLDQQKDKPQYNPLKNLKLKLKQFRIKSEENKKLKKDKHKFTNGFQNKNEMSGDIRKDMEDALMNSDEEFSHTSDHKPSKPVMSSYYYPTPFSTKSLADDKSVALPIPCEQSGISSTSSESLSTSLRDRQSHIFFETFLSPEKLKSTKLQMQYESEPSNSHFRGPFRIGVPSFESTQLKTNINCDRSPFSEKPLPVFCQNLQNSNKLIALQNIPNVDICSNKTSAVHIHDDVLTSDRRSKSETAGDELYLNYADILHMIKHSTCSDYSDLRGNENNDERTSFIKSNIQQKPPILKAKPCLKEMRRTDKISFANSSEFNITSFSTNFFNDYSLEKIMKCYNASKDIKCKKGLSHCEKLSNHLRSFVTKYHLQPNKKNITETVENSLTKCQQKLKTCCLNLVTCGKSMLIASTASKATFTEKVTKSIHCLADFSLETKHFGQISNSESDIKKLITQFVYVTDLFELTIDACEELLRESDENTCKMKSLLELANDLAKGLSTLLNVVSSLSIQLL